MYRRLVAFGMSVVAVAVIALVIPLGLAARDIVRAEEMSEIADHARVVADAWEVAWQKSGGEHDSAKRVPRIVVPPGDGTVTLIPPQGAVVGPAVPEGAGEVVLSAKDGRSATAESSQGGYASAPVLLDEEVGVVLVSATAENLREGLAPRLVALAVVSLVLVVFAAVAAWMLARRTARPIRELAATADAMADGDLTARADLSTISEVHDVGIALNRLAVRVGELLDDERAGAAELAHQLRTPLTVLTIDIDAVADEEVRARLSEDALSLQRTTDEIITNARRSSREGLRARCDAVEVIADRSRFWQVLAEDQHRECRVQLPEGPLWVRLTADDLATLTDIVLQNVFIHTPEGTSFALDLSPRQGGGALLSLRDRGPGLPSGLLHEPVRPQGRPGTGSTGLGLSIARRLAEASGGELLLANTPGNGAHVTVSLGPATD